MGGVGLRLSLYAAALATGGAFSVLFAGETSPGRAFLVMVGAALVALLVGSAGRYRFVSVLPATALYALLAVYGWPPLSLSGWRGVFQRIGVDLYEAASVMYVYPIPYEPHPGLFMVLIPLVMITVAFATSATLYEESPVISVAVLGLTIGVLSTISFEAGIGPFFALFLASSVALLLCSGATAPGKMGQAGLVAAGVVVALVLALPQFVEASVRPGLIDWTRIGTGGASRLSVQADVGDYLTSGRDTELLRVWSSEPLLWRGGTLDHFDGTRWSDTTAPGEDDGEEISPGVETRFVEQRVRVLNAQTNLVFGGYKIMAVSLPTASEGSDASWRSQEPLAVGSYYRVLSEIPQPTRWQLQNAGTAYPVSVEARFLQLPEDRPPVIAETAQKIQRDYSPETPYEAARAIERYLLYDGGFTYNLDADFRQADRAIEEFLGEGREGFCTQFATSMALLSREMGVPSRVVYGATTGQADEPGEYVVSGRDMHTWVELYFPGVGWYPFDPTPGFSVPYAMEANAPRPELPASQQNVTPETPALQDESGEETPEEPRDATGGEKSGASTEGTPLWPLYALVPIALLIVPPLLKRALLFRGRPEDLYRDLLGRLRDVLPPGGGALADSPALTPTERILLLAGAAGLEDGPFGKFARAYSDHLYSADPAGAARSVRSAYRRALREYGRLPLWRRFLGAVNPASLLSRAQRSLTETRAGLGKALRKQRRR